MQDVRVGAGQEDTPAGVLLRARAGRGTRWGPRAGAAGWPENRAVASGSGSGHRERVAGRRAWAEEWGGGLRAQPAQHQLPCVGLGPWSEAGQSGAHPKGPQQVPGHIGHQLPLPLSRGRCVSNPLASRSHEGRGVSHVLPPRIQLMSCGRGGL